jgi:hypothetical protein
MPSKPKKDPAKSTTKSATSLLKVNNAISTTSTTSLEEAKESATPVNVKLKTAPSLYTDTQEHLQKLSEKLGCPILAYFKPPSGNIWSQDLYAIMQCLKIIGKTDKLAVYIRSDGGSGMVSLRIIHLLRSFVKKLILLAPAECASAATMLALGCDEIHMGPLSSLSPVDSSITHALAPLDRLNNKVPVSLDELWRVVRLWQEAEGKGMAQNKPQQLQDSTEGEETKENPYKYLYQYVHPLVFGAVDRYSSLSVRICKEILSYHIKDNTKIDRITACLNYDYPSHGYPITQREAHEIGLPVKNLDSETQGILSELQLLYGEVTEEKITDYDRTSYHDNSVYSIVETVGAQLRYQQNYDKFYLENEKRYITLNDQSGWNRIKIDKKGKQITEKVFL